MCHNTANYHDFTAHVPQTKFNYFKEEKREFWRLAHSGGLEEEQKGRMARCNKRDESDAESKTGHKHSKSI